jgi:hypothetical protein
MARPTVAHGETVGLLPEMIQAPAGAVETHLSLSLPPIPGLRLLERFTHSCAACYYRTLLRS